MTESEQERSIGADFIAKRAAERLLACLEGKKARMMQSIDLMKRLLGGHGIIDAVAENTLHLHDGAISDRQHWRIDFPTAEEVSELLRSIGDTEAKIKEIESRLGKV